MTTKDGAGTRNPDQGIKEMFIDRLLRGTEQLGNEKEQGKRLGSAQHQLDDEMTRRPPRYFLLDNILGG